MSNFTSPVANQLRALADQLEADAQSRIDNVMSELLGLARLGARVQVSADTSRKSAPAVREKGAKRTPAELEALSLKLHTYILKNPGQRVEQIAEGLAVDTKELVLPLKKLIAGNAVKTKGVKRATRYTAR